MASNSCRRPELRDNAAGVRREPRHQGVIESEHRAGIVDLHCGHRVGGQRSPLGIGGTGDLSRKALGQVVGDGHDRGDARARAGVELMVMSDDHGEISRKAPQPRSAASKTTSWTLRTPTRITASRNDRIGPRPTYIGVRANARRPRCRRPRACSTRRSRWPSSAAAFATHKSRDSSGKRPGDRAEPVRSALAPGPGDLRVARPTCPAGPSTESPSGDTCRTRSARG